MTSTQYLLSRIKILEHMLVKKPDYISIAIYHEHILLIVTSIGADVVAVE